MKTFLYKTTGQLTGTIQADNIGLAQAYLSDDDMTQYVDDGLEDAVAHIAWQLHANGHNYTVLAKTVRKLTADELRVLSEWTSGQNSDGLGEGFEQQEFAETEQEDCYSDHGEEDDDCVCDEGGSMISFDWKTNKSIFEMVS